MNDTTAKIEGLIIFAIIFFFLGSVSTYLVLIKGENSNPKIKNAVTNSGSNIKIVTNSGNNLQSEDADLKTINKIMSLYENGYDLKNYKVESTDEKFIYELSNISNLTNIPEKIEIDTFEGVLVIKEESKDDRIENLEDRITELETESLENKKEIYKKEISEALKIIEKAKGSFDSDGLEFQNVFIYKDGETVVFFKKEGIDGNIEVNLKSKTIDFIH